MIKKKTCLLAAAAMSAAVLLSGCEVKEVITSVGKGDKEYGKAETMVILTTERLRYEEVYTEELWSAAVDREGTTFEEVLLSQVHDFLIDLKTMSDMAEEQDVVLTSREKELVKEAAAIYYEALGASEAAEFGLEQEDAENLYEDYWTAEKLAEQLTEATELEVSDSEAKVITVAQIELSDRETADRVMEEVLEEGADFIAIAKEYTEAEEVRIQIHRDMMGTDFETAAFAMAEGEVSEVIEEDGQYYILQCLDDYDEEATRIRKEQMIRDKRAMKFHTSYQAYKEEHPLTGDEELWTGLAASEYPDVTADFFAVYEQVCKAPDSEERAE